MQMRLSAADYRPRVALLLWASSVVWRTTMAGPLAKLLPDAPKEAHCSHYTGKADTTGNTGGSAMECDAYTWPAAVRGRLRCLKRDSLEIQTLLSNKSVLPLIFKLLWTNDDTGSL